MTEIEIDYLRQQLEKAERREEQFRNWWTGVSKQLRDLQHENTLKDWEHATSCETHGKQLQDLDADVLRLHRLHDGAETERVKLVTGLHALQDIVLAYRAGDAREDLTVDELMGVFERTVWRTLGQKVETKKGPVTPRKTATVVVEPEALFSIGGRAA